MGDSSEAPVPRLLKGWASTLAAAENSAGRLKLILAGGGAGGVELALAMRSRFQHAEPTVIHSGPRFLPGHNSSAQHIARNLLLERNVAVITEARVVEVMPDHVRLDDGKLLPRTSFSGLHKLYLQLGWGERSGYHA